MVSVKAPGAAGGQVSVWSAAGSRLSPSPIGPLLLLNSVLGAQASCSWVGAKSPGSVTLVSRSPYLLSPGTLSVKWGVGVEHHSTVRSPHQPPGLCRRGAGEAGVGQVGPLREPLHSTEGHTGAEV